MPDIDIDGVLNEAVTALTTVLRADVTSDATLNDLGYRFDAVRGLAEAAAELHGQLEVALHDAMPADRVAVPHVGTLVREKRKDRVVWDADAARRALRERILARVSLDPETGELRPEWRAIAASTFEWVARTWGLNAPKTGTDSGLRALDVDPNEYRTFEPTGWIVRVAP